MKTKLLRLTLVALAVAATSPADRAFAEVSINPGGDGVFVQARPGEVWSRFRQGAPTSHLLNPFGDALGDGLPSIARNPATGAMEVAWCHAGTDPAVMFACWKADVDKWAVWRIDGPVGSSPWKSQVTQLVHDDTGNRYVLHEDVDAARILLGSAPRDSHLMNRAIVVSDREVAATAPSMFWDGEALVIAWALRDVPGGLEVVDLVPDRDVEGRIPNGGEGVPGIPEPVFQYRPPRQSQLILHLGPRVGGPRPPGQPLHTVPAVPPMIAVEALPDGRILITWVVGDAVAYVVREGGAWGEVLTVPLAEPVEHEAVRDVIRRQLAGGGSLPGRGRPQR